MAKRPHIIIVGAGIAGLACARALKNEFTVEIFEAQNRIGGRICTDYSLGFALGKGAGWIHGCKGNPITKIAKKTSIPYTLFQSYNFAVFDLEGQKIELSAIEKFDETFDALLSKAKKNAFLAASDSSLSQALKPLLDKSNLNKSLIKDKLKYFENYIGASYEHLSARHFDHEQNLPGGHAILHGGYDHIIEELAKDLKIRLESPVIKISEEQTRMVVETKNDRHYADAVLVTVPLRILQKNAIEFDPPLKNSKKQAIDRLGMGLFNIIALKFPKVFWDKNASGMFFSKSESLATFLNYYNYCGEPVLLGYTGGDSAQKIENLTDQEIIALIVDNFKQHYSNVVPPESYFITRWSKVPFIEGSYSYLPVGATPQDRKLLAAPASHRLFFAGEATSTKYPACTHGAYWSGMREARRIKKIFFAIKFFCT
jgi:polyamine oxidase